MRCPVSVMIGSCTVVKASAARIGLWLSRWTPSRRRLAEMPISRSAGRLVSRFLMPKSSGLLIVVSVRKARPSFVVLRDRGVFVVDVQARGDAFGDHPGAEPARCRSRSAPA